MITKRSKFLSGLLAFLMVASLFAAIPFVTNAATAKYVKVTEEPADWSGTYLIVYEDGGKAFNGGLSNPDAQNNFIAVTISNDEIASNADTDAAKVTIAACEGGYSIEMANGYIGGGNNVNRIIKSSSSIDNTISLDNGNAHIVSYTSVLRFNTGWPGFRYYKSSGYTNQQAIQLYKLTEAAVAPEIYTITWKLDADTVIDTTEVEAGVVPTHADPVKESDAQYDYVFAGWDNEPVAATADATYTAIFTAVPNVPTYAVTVTGGANTTPNDAAAASQNVIQGEAMTAVTYTADRGYYFTEYTATTVDGVTVELSNGAIVVSGTPTADVAISVPNAVLANITNNFVGTSYPYSDFYKSACFALIDLTPYVTVDNNKDGTITVHMPEYINSTVQYRTADFIVHYGFEKGSGTSMASIGQSDKMWGGHTTFYDKDYTIDITTGEPRTALLTLGHFTYQETCPNGEYYFGLTRYTNPVKITYDLGGGNVAGETESKTEYLLSGEALGTTFAAPEKEGFVFDGWYTAAEGGEKVTESAATSAATYYAHWAAIPTYTITWKLDENTVIDTTSVAYGTVPTHDDAVKAEDDDFTYEFAGWDPEVIAVTGEATYTAIFTAEPKIPSGLVFDADGEIRFYVDGEPIYAGLVQDAEGNYYYINSTKKAVKDCVYGVSEATANGLLPEGFYTFDADGKIVFPEPEDKEGVTLDPDGKIRYYVEGFAVYAGLVQDGEGNYYYIGSDKTAVKDGEYFIGTKMSNGLLPAGYYTFDEDGKIVFPEIKEGLILDTDGEIRFYVDGVAVYAGLVQDGEGNYYYINSSKQAVKDCEYFISTKMSNGLLPAGYYTFDADGKIVFPAEPEDKNGLIADADGEIRFYVDGVAVYAGLVQDGEGNYYYINSAKKAIKSCTYGITTAKANGLLPTGLYTFGADGKMIID